MLNLFRRSILLLVFHFVAAAFAVNDHSRLTEAETGLTFKTRPIEATQKIQELINFEDLNNAIEVFKGADGEFSVRAKNLTSAAEARARIRVALENFPVLDALDEHFDDEIEISVINKQTGVISKQKVPIFGAAMIAALSIPSRDEFRSGRRLFLTDNNKKLTSLSLMSNETERVKTIKTNLGMAKHWANQLRINFLFTQKYEEQEPPEQFFSWNTKEESYGLTPNKAMRELWETRKAASQVLQDPVFSKELTHLKNEVSDQPNKEAVAEAFLARDNIAPIAYHDRDKHPRLAAILKRSVSKFLKGKNNPNDPESFNVSKKPLAYGQSVVSPQKPATERVAFIYPDGNSSLRKNTARASGITHVFNISHPSQAVSIIKDLHSKSGKPIEVCFCSHGSAGMLVMANPSSSEIDLLTKETKGMVCGAYALGCSVGAQAENISRPHLLRELAVGWGVPVSAVDQTLYLDNSKWYLQSSGRLVTVSPKNYKLDPQELIDQTPVWLLPKTE